MTTVQSFRCPDVYVPESAKAENLGKRQRGDMGWDKEAKKMKKHVRDNEERGSGNERDRNRGDKNIRADGKKDVSTKEDLRAAYRDVRELAATTYMGLMKQKHKDDVLTKLGVRAPKEQTMPFKMKMGILEGRKKRQEKIVQRAKESGVILAPLLFSTDNKEETKSRNKNKSDVAPDLDIHTKGGVFHLSKNKLPAKLLNAAGGRGQGRGDARGGKRGEKGRSGGGNSGRGGGFNKGGKRR